MGIYDFNSLEASKAKHLNHPHEYLNQPCEVLRSPLMAIKYPCMKLSNNINYWTPTVYQALSLPPNRTGRDRWQRNVTNVVFSVITGVKQAGCLYCSPIVVTLPLTQGEKTEGNYLFS